MDAPHERIMIPAPKRIMIIGQPGSGKSTLAASLGKITGLPVYHIDKEVHWLPNWVERDRTEKARLCAEIHAKEKWIFEGGHSSTWNERLARADMLIWLDLPLWLRYWRVITRTIKHYGKSRHDLPKDCPEHFSWEFIYFIWRTRHTSRDSMVRIFEQVPVDKRRYQLTTAHEADAFLHQIKEEYSNSPA